MSTRTPKTEPKEPRTAMNFTIVDPPSASVPKPVERCVTSSQRYVYFGEDNLYPDYLLGCYSDCATLQAVINGTADYIAGKGFVDPAAESKIVDEDGGTLLTLVQRCVADYLIFGALTIGVRRNSEKQIAALDYHDPRHFRLSADGKTAYYCKNWAGNSRKVVAYPVFNPANREPNSSVFYFKAPRCRTLYGLPMWSSATKDVQTAIEISTFHLSAIMNNFVPSAIVNFNNGTPDEATQKEIEDKLVKKFSGSKNAARLLVSFNDSRVNATTLERLSEDHFDQRYNALAKSCKENIFIAFRAHPQLFGADPERQGFNSVEYENTFKLFKETVVQPLQREIEGAFAFIGDEYRFTLNEFTINFNQKASV